jgi:hypothetical protein
MNETTKEYRALEGVETRILSEEETRILIQLTIAEQQKARTWAEAEEFLRGHMPAMICIKRMQAMGSN